MGLTRPRAAQIYDIDYKQAVRVITTTNITLTGGAPLVVDGVTLSLRDRILVTGQTTGSQNGIYQVSVTGTGSNGTWIRSSDTNETGELLSGTIVMVTEGTTYKDTSWKLTTDDPITIGTTTLTFEINTGNAFGVISANGTSVVANSATGTVTFSTANNLVITGNAASDTVTFEVSQSPNFTGNVVVSGVVGSNLIPSANIVYNLGNTTNRWKDIWLSNSTIYLGNAQISANATSLILTNPQGAQTVLSGTTPDISASTITATGNITGGNLITSGLASVGTTLSVTGNANVGNLGTAGQVIATGNVTGGNLITTGLASVTGNITGGNLTTSGALSVTGIASITGGVKTNSITSATAAVTFYDNTQTSISIGGAGTLANVKGTLNVVGNANVGNIGATNANLTALTATGNANVGNIGATNAVLAGSLTGVTTISASGNANVGNLGATAIVATGAISGSTTLSVTGNANVGNLGATNANLSAVTVTGNANIGNLGTTAIVATGAITGSTTLSITGNANVGNLGTAGLVTATGNVTGGNLVTSGQLTASGNITGNYLLANITFASGYNTTKLFNGTSEANIGTSGGNANITIGGVSNVAVFSTAGANISGTLGVTGNVTGGNVITSGVVYINNSTNATGNGTGALQVAGGGSFSKDVWVMGNVYAGNIVAVVANTLTVQDPLLYLTANTPYPYNYDIGFYSQFQTLPGAQTAANGYQHTGWFRQSTTNTWYLFSNVATEPTSVITLDANTVYDPFKSGAITSTGNVTATGNVSGGNIVTTGLISATANITGGNLITTGVLSATGNANVGNLGATNAVLAGSLTGVTTISASGNANVGNLGTAGQITATGNVTAGGFSTTGNVTAAYFLGNVSQASGIFATKIFNGTSEANIVSSGGNLAISIGGTSNVLVVSTSGANVSGTLNATGNANVGNLGTSGLIVATGNVTGGNLVTTGLISATGNITGGNLTTTGTANIGTLAVTGAGTVTGNITGGNLITAGLISATGNITGGNILGNGRSLTGINAFSTISITGQSDVVADSIADTLTLVAGNNISITTNATTDTITISYSSGGTGQSPFLTNPNDFGLITESYTDSQDLGLITEASSQNIDLGGLVTSGLIYPDQLVLPTYTVATLPSAAIPAQFIYVSNAANGAITAFSDGTNWRRTSDRSIVT